MAELELLSIALEGLVMINDGEVAAGMRRLDEAAAAAMAGEMTNLDAIAQTCCVLLFACERARDYDRAAQWTERIHAFCRRWQIEPLFALCRTQYAAMLIGNGRWSEAEQELATAMDALQHRRPLLVGDAVVQLAELRRRQGRFDEALELYRSAENRTESLLGRANISLDRGDAAAAIDLAERLLRRALGEKWIERANAMEILVRAHAVHVALLPACGEKVAKAG